MCVDQITENGRAVVVALVKTDNQHEDFFLYDESGAYATGQETHLDLVECGLWAGFQIDEPVMVKGALHQEWFCRKFAGVKDGKPTAWPPGQSSSGSTNPIPWDQCRKPSEGELK